MFKKRSSYSQDQTIKSAKQQNAKLLSSKEALDYKTKAEKRRENFNLDTRWESWRWLIRKNTRVNKQLRLLQECSKSIDWVEKNVGLIKPDDITAFIHSYESFIDSEIDIRTLEDLRKAIAARRDVWIEVQETINKVSPPVFFAHAFLKLSDSTGIEVVSLFIGSLLALGAIYMAVFFKVAVNLSSADYWTLEDLTVHGILVLPVIVIALGIAELVFFLGRRSYGYRPHEWILKKPLRVVVIFLAWSVVAVAVAGYSIGKLTFREFVNNSTQMATVMDRTVLRGVYLVGTTDRTAIFLQPKPEAASQSLQDWVKAVKDSPKSNYRLDRRHFFSSDAFRPWRVLVMDRALIVCHGQEGDCEPAGDEHAGTPIQVVDQSTKLGMEDMKGQINLLSKNLGELRGEIESEFDYVHSHMDRHRALYRADFREITGAISASAARQ